MHTASHCENSTESLTRSGISVKTTYLSSTDEYTCFIYVLGAKSPRNRKLIKEFRKAVLPVPGAPIIYQCKVFRLEDINTFL